MDAKVVCNFHVGSSVIVAVVFLSDQVKKNIKLVITGSFPILKTIKERDQGKNDILMAEQNTQMVLSFSL